MSVRRAVVDCAVLSLRDACVFYPSCRGCCSRLDVDQTRCRCSKCGYSCAREQADYRYRLSLRVTRDDCIFAVTVFGACLNPFFGINASGLQRLVENLEGPVGASTRSTLLQRAVEDCFIGKHFIFGLKASGTESWPWAGVNGSGTDTAHYIASQMILPKAPGLEGCTVVRYYQALLQKAAEHELDINDPGKASRLPAATLLLRPHHSPANSTCNSSGLLSQSLPRYLSQDCSLTPTPPWQQSLGLVTSSAEQEEDYGDKNSTANSKTPHHAQAQRGCWEDELVRSPPHLSLANFKYSPVGNSSPPTARFSPSSADHILSKTKGFPAQEPAETSSSSSVAWEDFPMSESLTEFLCKENQNVEPEPQLNVQNQKDTTRTSSETRSQDDTSTESTLLDASNTSVLDGDGGLDVSDQVWRNPSEYTDRDQATKVCPHECNQEEEKGNFLPFENEEEQLAGDTYNCSADLFSSSAIDVNTNTVNMQAGTLKTSTEASPDVSKFCRPGSQTVHVPQSTPDKRKHQSNKRRSSDSFMLQDFDFIPPSQSTPIVRAAVLSPPPTHRTATSGERCSQSAWRRLQRIRKLPDFDNRKPEKSTSPCQSNMVGESNKENVVSGGTCSRNSQNFTPKRKFWKPAVSKGHVQTRQHLRVRKSSPDTGSTGTTGSKRDCDVTNVPVCDYEDCDAIVVPPTPAAHTQGSVLLRRQWPGADRGQSCEEQRPDGAVCCKRPLLDQTLTATCRAPPQAGGCARDSVTEGNPDRSHCFNPDDENEACDWSRDLFSDSI